jgi:hypothetical protein
MKKAAFLITILLLLSSPVLAQKEFFDIDEVGNAVGQKIRATMKDWECHDIEPMSFGNTAPSADLRIQQWISDNRQVRLVLHIHASAEEAARALRQFAGSRSSYLHGLGDEAYLYSARNGIAFRKGNLLVYVSAIVIKEKYTEAEKKDPKYATGIDLGEERAAVMQFAHLVAGALKKG